MPKRSKPLTDIQIKNFKPSDKLYDRRDGDGLILRINTSGAKKWLFNYYRPSTKKRNNLSLGEYPSLSLSAARVKKEACKKLLAEGIDPKIHSDQQTLQQSNTLKEVASSWFAVKKVNISQGYAEDIWHSLENHIFKQLGDIPITDIEAPTTIEIIRPVSHKGNHDLVKRLCQRLNEIMVFSVNYGTN